MTGTVIGKDSWRYGLLPSNPQSPHYEPRVTLPEQAGRPPSNPLVERQSYTTLPFCKFVDRYGRVPDSGADWRGLKHSTDRVVHSSKHPRRTERNPSGGLWMQGRQRVHYSCNRAKPNRPRTFSEAGMTLEQFAAAWVPTGWAGDVAQSAGKAKERRA